MVHSPSISHRVWLDHSKQLPSLRSNSFEEGEDDTNLDHILEGHNMEDGTSKDHNFDCLRGAMISKIGGAIKGDWLMEASKVGICVCMVTHT